jgi:hypothetical protein
MTVLPNMALQHLITPCSLRSGGRSRQNDRIVSRIGGAA